MSATAENPGFSKEKCITNPVTLISNYAQKIHKTSRELTGHMLKEPLLYTKGMDPNTVCVEDE